MCKKKCVERDAVIEALSGMPADVRAIALAYARSMVTFGVNIAEKRRNRDSDKL